MRKLIIITCVVLVLFIGNIPQLQARKTIEAEKAVSVFFNALKQKDWKTLETVALDPPSLEAKSFSIVMIIGPNKRNPPQRRAIVLPTKNNLKKSLVEQFMDTADEKDDLEFESKEKKNKKELLKQAEIKKVEQDLLKEKLRAVMRDSNGIYKIAKLEEKLAKLSLGDIDLENTRFFFNRYIAVVNVTLTDGRKKKMSILLRQYITKSTPLKKGKTVIEHIH